MSPRRSESARRHETQQPQTSTRTCLRVTNVNLNRFSQQTDEWLAIAKCQQDDVRDTMLGGPLCTNFGLMTVEERTERLALINEGHHPMIVSPKRRCNLCGLHPHHPATARRL